MDLGLDLGCRRRHGLVDLGRQRRDWRRRDDRRLGVDRRRGNDRRLGVDRRRGNDDRRRGNDRRLGVDRRRGNDRRLGVDRRRGNDRRLGVAGGAATTGGDDRRLGNDRRRGVDRRRGNDLSVSTGGAATTGVSVSTGGAATTGGATAAIPGTWVGGCSAGGAGACSSAACRLASMSAFSAVVVVFFSRRVRALKSGSAYSAVQRAFSSGVRSSCPARRPVAMGVIGCAPLARALAFASRRSLARRFARSRLVAGCGSSGAAGGSAATSSSTVARNSARSAARLCLAWITMPPCPSSHSLDHVDRRSFPCDMGAAIPV